MDWDSRFPSSPQEVTLFANLQTKATKFPLPEQLKQRAAPPQTPANDDSCSQADFFRSRSQAQFANITAAFEHARAQFSLCQDLLRHLDLLLEAHKQLCLLSSPDSQRQLPASPPSPSVAKSELLSRLTAVQARIAALAEQQQATDFIDAAVLPSMTASPVFLDSLRCLHQAGAITPQLLEKTQSLMRRCWSNTLAAMERVLAMDLDTIEAYIDDCSYTELKEKMLRPLLRIIALDPVSHAETLNDFALEYAQLRENSIRFLVNERLLSLDAVFSTSQPQEQIMHLIERARLLMKVEAREFDDLFGSLLASSKCPARNRILETVGNLIYERIETLSRECTDSTQVSSLIQSLLESLLLLQSSSNIGDPFAVLLQLLQRNLFPLPTAPTHSDEILEV